MKMTLNDGLAEITLEKKVFLPSQKGLSGLVISNDNKLTLTILGVSLVVIILLFIAFRIFRRFRRNTKKIVTPQIKKKKKRDDLIEIEV